MSSAYNNSLQLVLFKFYISIYQLHNKDITKNPNIQKWGRPINKI